MVNNHSYNGDKPTNFGIYVTLLQPCFNCTGRNGGFPWHWMGYISRLYVYIYMIIYIYIIIYIQLYIHSMYLCNHLGNQIYKNDNDKKHDNRDLQL